LTQNWSSILVPQYLKPAQAGLVIKVKKQLLDVMTKKVSSYKKWNFNFPSD
jgi:hypothetical protein